MAEKTNQNHTTEDPVEENKVAGEELYGER